MYCKDGKVYVEKEDHCTSCKNFKKAVACPLLEALGLGLVNLEGTMYVYNWVLCKYVRH